MMEKVYTTVTELVKQGLPKRYVLRCCNSEYGNRFARRTCKGGKWIIDAQKFHELHAAGYFED